MTAFIRLGRPVYLGGAFLLYALGAAVARMTGHAVDVRTYVLGQLAVSALQLMTHYSNEYFDFEADVANTTPTQWSGGSRVLPNGQLPRRAALLGALAFACLGIALAIVLRGHAWSTPTLLVILVLAWEYSAPPLRLCARGAGELDTAIVVACLVPWLGFCLQAPDLLGLRLLVLAVVPLALLQFAMLLAIEFPDRVGDAATGKRTLVVRFGPGPAALLYALITALAFVWLPVAFLLGLPAAVAWCAALPAPIAIWRISRIADHARPEAHPRLTLFSVALLGAMSACMLIGFAISGSRA